jgi:hypothetical protein
MMAAQRWPRVAAALAGLALAVAACGVPTGGKPKVDKVVPRNPSGFDQVIAPPPGPDDATLPATLVDDYLKAIAGLAPADQLAAAQAYWNGGQRDFTPVSAMITVVRQTTDLQVTPAGGNGPPNGEIVKGDYEILGTFDPQTGRLSPPTAKSKTEATYTFEMVKQADGLHYRLTGGPGVLMMSDTALSSFYRVQVIYLWDADHLNLIPDLRYIRATLYGTPGRAAKEVVSAVVAGAATEWVSDAVAAPFAAGLTVTDAVALPVRDGRYQVDLAANTAGALSSPQLIQIDHQLRWSLGSLVAAPNENPPSPLEILIGGAPRLTDDASSQDAYADEVTNLSPLRGRAQTATYLISQGQLLRVDDTLPNAQPPRLLPNAHVPATMDPAADTGVQSAAVNSTESDIAMVRLVGNQEQLWVRRTDGAARTLRRVTGLPTTGLSKPQFLISPAGYLVIAGGGHIYLVSRDDTAVPIAMGGLGPITAFSVAADSRRIALVSGGRLFLSVLVNVGTEVPALIPAHPIDVKPLLRSVSLVVWASMRQLSVAGESADTGALVVSVNPDGAGLSRLLSFGGLTFQQMSSFVVDPLAYPSDTGGHLLIQTSQAAFRDTERFNSLVSSAIKAPSDPFYQD